ncbi:MAG: 1-deoxy-D-xylulose-5-phosphate synthase [Holosporales bacterium]|jgi:1-deoxy-D-xylulose-5-phosphate synthase|nr:1-deoxy-D-xylulose-5-phosphate synthase [Holosporales bacterium]
MLLDSVNSPIDLKKLSIEELSALCNELRDEIVSITSKNGGHLGSNLGIIELTVAMHYIFNAPVDKFIFDVGHQCYAHKLLTGRQNLMKNLRQEGGASGFIDPLESEYDCFISGHASTSISASLGIAKARDLNHQNFKVISIVGDGSMSGGMIYEAINNIGSTRDFIVILNDNQMSISKTVGGMSKYLSKLLSSKKMLSARGRISSFLEKMPKKTASIIENFIKNCIGIIKGSNIFENLGFQYIGPVDGHDLQTLLTILENVRDYATHKPVLLHVFTEKGKGHKPAEDDIYKLHGVTTTEKSPNSFGNIFSRNIVELAKNNKKIVCITAAMKSGCGLSEFANLFPERFFDVGIAEAHAVTFAAGLTKEGFSPFVCIYSTFLQRAFDQIYHDVFLQNLPVRFIVDKAGLPGKDGKTHSGIYDIAMFSMFENFHIFVPSNTEDFEEALCFAGSNNDSPTVIRFSKSDIPALKEKYISQSSNTLIINVGGLLSSVQQAIKISGIKGDIFDVFKIQPFDFEKLATIIDAYKYVFVVENGIAGGFASTLQTYVPKKLHIITISKIPVIHDSREKQMENNALGARDIADMLIKTCV